VMKGLADGVSHLYMCTKCIIFVLYVEEQWQTNIAKFSVKFLNWSSYSVLYRAYLYILRGGTPQ
jgi:hypothetical protein